MVSIKIDRGRAIQAFRDYSRATKHDGAETLNRFGRDVAYRSAQFTPKATAARIRADLKRNPRLRFALTSMMLKRAGKGILPSPQFAEAVEKLMGRRSSTAAYLRATFAAAIRRFAGQYRGKPFHPSAGGYASKASISRLVVEIVGTISQPNGGHATSAEAILIRAVHMAIDSKLTDMEGHANKLLAKRAKGVSG